MYILMDYHTTCEVCGKHIEGVIARHVMDNNSSLLGSIGNDIADSVDAANAKVGLKKQVEEKRWASLNFSNGSSGQRCPFCGAHQSWENLPEPVEPEKPGSEKDKAGNIGSAIIFAIIGGIIGMLVGLFIMIFTNVTGLIISAIVGIILGFAIGIWGGKMVEKDKEESYPDEIEKYKEYVKEYNEFQESLKTRTAKYEPVVNIESVRLSRKSDDNTEAEWPGLRRML